MGVVVHERDETFLVGDTNFHQSGVHEKEQAPETTGVGRLAVTCGKALTSPVDSSTIFRLAFLRRQ
jgi:hypothetical protein